MAITTAFQAVNVGSIPTTCSIIPDDRKRNVICSKQASIYLEFIQWFIYVTTNELLRMPAV